MHRGAPLHEAVEAVVEGLLAVAALMYPPGYCDNSGDLIKANPLISDRHRKKSSEGTLVVKREHVKFVLCVRSTFEFETVFNVFNVSEDFVAV